MRNWIRSSFLVILFVAGCGAVNPADKQSSLKTVFGDDNRILIDNPRVYPWTAVGRFEQSNGSWCTGVMMWHNLVLTNAHCVIDSNAGPDAEVKPLVFKAGAMRDQFFATAEAIDVWKGTPSPDGNRAADYAVVVLSSSIGRQTGWFDLREDVSFPVLAADATPVLNGGFSYVGYPSDVGSGKVPSLHKNCSIAGEDADHGFLLHDCDTYAGSSGGPLFDYGPGGRPRVVGLNSAEMLDADRHEVLDGSAFSLAIANIATKVSRFSGVLKLLKTQYPEGATETNDPLWDIKICNASKEATVYAVLANRESRLATLPTAHGWYGVNKGQCIIVNIEAPAPIYGFAGGSSKGIDAGPTWPAVRDKPFCINGNDAFTSDSDRPCRENENHWYRQFLGALPLAGTNGTYVWTISD